MKNLKRILFLLLALVFVCSVPITGAKAAGNITAKSVFKDALYKKPGTKDQLVVSLNLNAEIDTKEMKEKTHENMHGNSSIQLLGNDYVSVMHYKNTINDKNDVTHYYKQYDAKKKNLTSYICGDDSNTYSRFDNANDDTNIITFDYKKLYKYMLGFKFVKKDTEKNGKKAYCVSAKFDCAKYLNNESSEYDEFASTILTLFPKNVGKKNIYAKVTAYIDQKTGMLISMKLDMNQYFQTVKKDQFEYDLRYEDKNSDYSINVKATNSYLMLELNPSKLKKISMPGNYSMLNFNKDGVLQSEITYKKNKKAIETLYSENGFVTSTYDTKGTLLSEVLTKYAEETAVSKLYKNGELTTTTECKRPDSITVSNVKELMDAIGKYNLIYLEKGEYNLSNFEIARDNANPYVYVNNTYDGFEYIFNQVNHLTMIGKGDVSIVIEPRYSTVLTINNSWDVTLKNLTIGHTTAKGECEGGVLYFGDCSKVLIDSCHLYGCGILGITTENVDDLKMVNSEIYDCTYGIMALKDTSNAIFRNCKFRDNVGFDMIDLDGCTSITYDKCKIYNNQREFEDCDNFIESNNNIKILFKNCEYYDNTKGYSLTEDDDIEFKDCDIRLK